MPHTSITSPHYCQLVHNKIICNNVPFICTFESKIVFSFFKTYPLILTKQFPHCSIKHMLCVLLIAKHLSYYFFSFPQDISSYIAYLMKLLLIQNSVSEGIKFLARFIPCTVTFSVQKKKWIIITDNMSFTIFQSNRYLH